VASASLNSFTLAASSSPILTDEEALLDGWADSIEKLGLTFTLVLLPTTRAVQANSHYNPHPEA
jgi:hypothetical protein